MIDTSPHLIDLFELCPLDGICHHDAVVVIEGDLL